MVSAACLLIDTSNGCHDVWKGKFEKICRDFVVQTNRFNRLHTMWDKEAFTRKIDIEILLNKYDTKTVIRISYQYIVIHVLPIKITVFKQNTRSVTS